MPLIPRLQPSETGPAAGVTLDRERRPTVDTRELMQATGNLGAVRQPEINGAVMAAPFDALGSIGKAVMETGGILGALAVKQREAESDMQVARAQEQMEAARAEFETWAMTDVNPGGWVAAWDERWNAAKAQILEDETLNDGARQRLGIIAEQYGGAARVDVAKSAAKRSFAMAGSSYDARITRAIAAKDYGQAVNLSREKTAKGYGWDHETAALEADITKMQQRDEETARMNETISIARSQGRDAARKYADDNGADAIEKEKLLSAADSVHRDVLALKTEELSNAIASGQLTVPAEIDTWEPDNPAITPEVRAQYKAHMTRMNDAVERERQRANAPENMSRLVSEIQDLDPEKATDADFVRLDLAVQALPEGYRRVPSRKLDAKLDRARSLDTPDGDVAELGDDILHSLFKSGSFGSYDNGTGKDSKGNPAIGTENGEVFKRDEAQYRAAITRKAEVGGKFSRWLKANPKATPEQVQKRIYEITGEPVAASLLDDLFGPAPGPPSLGPVDITGALPTGTAGPPENILLPPP